MRKFLASTIFAAILLGFFTSKVFAHPGRLDAAGCHTCYTNCTEKWNLKYGEYHCHQKKVAKTSAKRKAKN
jgi:hypothetical protein